MFAKLEMPEGMTGCSWRGQDLETVDGCVFAPAEAVDDLSSHGLKLVEYQASEEDLVAQAEKEKADAEEAQRVREEMEAAAAAKKLLDDAKAPAIAKAEAEVEEAKNKLYSDPNVDNYLEESLIVTQKIAALEALKDG